MVKRSFPSFMPADSVEGQDYVMDVELGLMPLISSDMTPEQQEAAEKYCDRQIKAYYRLTGQTPPNDEPDDR